MPDGDTMDTSGNSEVKPGAVHPNGAPVENPSEEEPQTQNERELTQTDHLNKSLLMSFLNRLNDPNSGFPPTQQQQEASEADSVPQQKPPSLDNLQQTEEVSNGDAAHLLEETGKGEGDTPSQDDWIDRNDEELAE